jgi:3-oxoadipate enol-lactonase
MPDITINQVRTHYVRAGKGEPVVLIHGFTASHAMWWQQAPELARAGFRTYAYDLRGHGDSDHPGRGYDPCTLADDLAALFDALDLKRAHVVGLSLGGMVAQRFALAWPERTATLTVADSFSGTPPPAVMEIFQKHERDAREHGMHHLFEQLLVHPALPYGPDYQVPFEYFPALERAFLKNRLTTLSAYVEMMAGLPDWTTELAGIRCPTLLIVGDVDLPCLEPMRRMGTIIPDAESRVISRCGHSSAVEKAPEWNRLLLDFLRRHPLAD